MHVCQGGNDTGDTGNDKGDTGDDKGGARTAATGAGSSSDVGPSEDGQARNGVGKHGGAWVSWGLYLFG